MNNQDAYDIYELTTVSLRELLVPMRTVWLSQYNRIEQYRWTDTSLSYKVLSAMERHYTVPYAYRYSYMEEYVALKYGDHAFGELTREDLGVIYQGIFSRVKQALSSSVTDADIAVIDDNYDIGCIVHKLSGMIIPFDYSKVTGISFTATSAALDYRLEMQKHSPDSEMYKKLVNEMKTVTGHGSLKYVFNYNNPNGDAFHKVGEVFDAFPGNYTHVENIDPTIEYVNYAFNAHCKCIILA